MNNRFIKLLTLSVDKNEFLLYGFSSPTKQEIRSWRKKETKNKLKLNICRAILSYEDAKQFEQMLTEACSIPIGNMTLISPCLTPRSPMLTYKKGWENPDPIAYLCLVSEYWNMQKKELVSLVKSGLGTSGKQLYRDMQELFFQIKADCGIDFTKNGPRFGNYESYDHLDQECSLKVKIAENTDGKKIIIQKLMNWDRPLTINCVAEGYGRILFNQIRELLSDGINVEFTAEEAIIRYTVFAWDQETGQIVFFESNALLKHIELTFNVSSAPRSIHDPWSESLLSSAANRSEIIHNHIENVQQNSVFNTIKIGSENDSFYDAASSGELLLAPYTPKLVKGAFIPSEQKDGEIDSFLKIKEYLDAESVCSAVLADPYFSIPSAAKLLTRITNTDLELEIITSLTSTDPDSNEKQNIVENYRKFLKDNAGILHHKLYVYNLCRGKKQVFHDRYLIRYHKDGRIDGFLLSNSLNSMGQFYPFVIAPLESEVCYSVADYLNEMRNTEVQKKMPKKQRIACDVLFDYKQSVGSQKPQPKELTSWESNLLERKIKESDLPDVLNELWSHCEDDREKVCQVLSSLGGHTNYWSAKELAAVLKKNQSMADWYMECFLPMARSIESSRKHLKAGVNSFEFIFWSLLTGKSKPDTSGFTKLFNNHYPVYYSGEYWMFGGYKLLFELDKKSYFSLLDETCSPMMFSCLLEELECLTMSKELYNILTQSNNKCIQLTGICWYIYKLEMNKPESSDVFRFLDSLKPDIRLLQLVLMLSIGANKIRLSKETSNFWESIFSQLLECSSATLPKCNSEERQLAMDLVYDCEACSYCSIYLELAKLTSEIEIRKDLLNRAINIIKKELLECNYKKDLTMHISLYLDGMELLYGEQAEKEMINHFLDWEAFEAVVEPELKKYAHNRWYESYLRACWQLDMLEEYLKRHSQAERVIKWLNTWENRMEIIISNEGEQLT